ncbi:MAG TPA: YdeI/OmpD-associated family protein [Longimicrobiaceae bacterium]|nr:YdeI/OmpD-associated family protein [Longimicrobiaceae bacterium]
MEPVFFATPAAFRAWLEAHHETAAELWVGFHRKGSGGPSITWPEAVDEALCVGWIDGIRRRVDEAGYAIRFTPRRPRSTWSAVNLGRVAELTREGRMRPAGLAAFEARSGTYAYEQRAAAALDEQAEARFRARPEAWDFFQSRPPSYRKTAAWWVVSAKKEETRRRRLDTLIEESASGRAIDWMARRPRPPSSALHDEGSER